jgi:membrane-associated phospholipid phosphatase
MLETRFVEATIAHRDLVTPDDTPESAARSPGSPGRARLICAGVALLAAVTGVSYLQSVRLPYDDTFKSVLYLMWSANLGQSWIPLLMIGSIYVMGLVVSLFLIASAIVWSPSRSPGPKPLLGWCYRFAPCWPLLLLLSTLLGRAVANAVYALTPWAAGDLTPMLARLEGPLLEMLQGAVRHPLADTLFSRIYSCVWIIGLIGFGPWLVVRGQERAVSQVVLGTVLTSLLAVPFFLLVPVFDPWATNPIYGYAGPGQTAVRYLYPYANTASLSTIATGARWATGSCLPSLHVALPLVYALVAARHRMRAEAWLLACVTAATSVSVVYLGRHWIMDVIAAVPFALGISWLVQRIDPRLTLSWQSAGKRAE